VGRWDPAIAAAVTFGGPPTIVAGMFAYRSDGSVTTVRPGSPAGYAPMVAATDHFIRRSAASYLRPRLGGRAYLEAFPDGSRE
jgi:hypothetical protein